MRVYKIIVISFILGFLFLNMIQECFTLRKIYPLKGAASVVDTVPFNLKAWFDLSYQLAAEEKAKNNFGFSNLFVRLNNQIAYSIFNTARANGVVIGKDNYLYEKNYINAYYGLDFIGVDTILHNIQKLKVIQDSLEKYDKHLLIVFCPGKASYYPEQIPDNLKRQKTDRTNMRTYLKYAKQEDINYLNLYDLFLENKKISKHVLYTKYGIHWSSYGEYLALMEIHKVLKNKFKLPQPTIDLVRTERTLVPRDRDIDITEGLNLLVKPKSDTLTYPYLLIRNKTKPNPNAIVISDSFYWGIFEKNRGIVDKCWSSYLFDNNDFWYYNKEAYNNKELGAKRVSDLNLHEEINKNDVFIIMATEATIFELGWGAIDQFYHEVTHNKKPFTKVNRYKERIEHWKNIILNDAQWLKDAEVRGKAIGIDLDSAIILEAKYQVDIGR